MQFDIPSRWPLPMPPRRARACRTPGCRLAPICERSTKIVYV